MRKHDEVRRLRRTNYVLLIVIGLALVAGRIATVKSKEGSTAFLSANDRSRWCTVAALVEDGTFAIDRQLRLTDDRGRRTWQTIDRVQHRGRDGLQHSYSSKPPLLSVLIAGVYACVAAATGMTLTDQPIYVARIILGIVNLPLMATFLIATTIAIERTGVSDWARRFMVAATVWGTLLLPFAVSLNNHLPAAAAAAVMVAIYVTMSQKLGDDFAGDSIKPAVWIWIAAGIASGFLAANELPSLAFVALYGVLLVRLYPKSLIGYGVGMLIVAIAFFGTNWLAHGSLRPPYAHRGVGGVIARLDEVASDSRGNRFHDALLAAGAIDVGVALSVLPSDEPERLRIETSDHRWFAAVPTDSQPVDEATDWELRHWDDWYEYPGSYWQGDRRRGVDRGEPSRAFYFTHATIGHHGIFSLTPLWLLLPWSLYLGCRHRDTDRRRLFLAITVATTVCFLFYVSRPEIDRNYGGVSIGFRWMLWFAPLWLVACVPALDRLANTDRGRMVGIALLAASVFSVAASLDTPWQSPWIYRFWDFLGWMDGNGRI